MAFTHFPSIFSLLASLFIFFSSTHAHVIRSTEQDTSILSRQAQGLRDGAWLLNYKPAGASAPIYDGTLRVTSNDSALVISGDLYKRTSAPNPASGIPIFPRTAYYTYIRGTKFQPGSNGAAFSLGLDFRLFKGIREIGNYTIWDNQALDGGYTVALSPASAPTGYPSSKDYFEGDVVRPDGTVAGRLTMGWVKQYLRKITLEVGTVPGVKQPKSDSTGRHTFQSIFNAAGYEINVEYGSTTIKEPSNPGLPAGSWSREQQHDAVHQYRKPTDFDKEWRVYLLVVRLLNNTERGEVIDGGREFKDGVPREGAAVASHWIVGTRVNGQPDESVDWGSTKGKKFEELHDAWFRTCVHEVGHFWDLAHPPEFVEGVMTETPVYVEAGMNGWTEKKFPENIGEKAFVFTEQDRFYMAHLSDVHVRPGYATWGQNVSTSFSSIENVHASLGMLPK